jgi:hypothetical protein
MHARDEIISYGHFDAEITKLSGLLTELGIDVSPDSDLDQQTYAAFHALYYFDVRQRTSTNVNVGPS